MQFSRSRLLNRIAKSVAFRYTKTGAANYPYNVEPIELAFLIQQIERVRDLQGNLVEIGVARGMTTRFLVEHISSQQLESHLKYFAIDTFDSFTEADVEHEVRYRGKQLSELKDGFGYYDYEVWKRHFAKFPFVEAIKADCTLVDYRRLAPFKLVFLDVDLYLPTRRTLDLIYDSVVNGGAILVDDVLDGKSYDGAYQAYMEFTAERGYPPVIVGNKCGVIIKGDIGDGNQHRGASSHKTLTG